MRGLPFLSLALALLGPTALAAPRHALVAIQRGIQDGSLSVDEGLLYGLYALRQPHLLPPHLRSEPGAPLMCGTPILDAVHKAWDTLSPQTQREMEPLLRAPRASSCIQSEAVPVSVCWITAEAARRAETVLALAEQSWSVEVDGMGFYAPHRWRNGLVEEGQTLTIGLTDAGVGGYTSPDHAILDTPWLDSTTWIVINQDNGDDANRTTVPHEFAHACQFSMDSAETLMAMEGTAQLVAKLFDSRNLPSLLPPIRIFQNQPWRSLDWGLYGDIDTYEYGSVLFFIYLDEAFGDSDGTFIARLWEDSRQAGGGNEPDLFDAMADVAAEGAMTFDQVVIDFCEWRHYLGSLDDGRHFHEGWRLAGSEVWVERTLTLEDLPAGGLEPRYPPHDYGVTYIEVDPTGAEPGDQLTFRLQGDPAVAWALRGMVGEEITDGEPDGEGLGATIIVSSRSRPITFAVINLSDGHHDPDDRDWEGCPFTYDVLLTMVPRLLDAEPAEIAQGTTGAHVTVTVGEPCPGATVAVRGEGVTLTGAEEGEGYLTLVLDVAQSAPPGPRDVTVACPNGLVGTGVGLLAVSSSPYPEMDAMDPDQAPQGTPLIFSMVEGRGFMEGLVASLSGEGAVVVSAERRDDGQAFLGLRVEEGAPVGPRDLTITNPGGKAHTAEAIFTVLGADRPDGGGDIPSEDGGVEEPEPSPAPGGCTVAGGGEPLVSLLILLMALGPRCRGPRPRGCVPSNT